MSDKNPTDRWSYSVDGDSYRNKFTTTTRDNELDQLAEEAAEHYYQGCIDERSQFELTLYLHGVEKARRCIEVEKTYAFFVSSCDESEGNENDHE